MIKTSCRAALLLLLLSACSGDPKEAEVRKGVALVQRRLNATKHDMASGLAFAAMSEQGGTALSFIAASLPDNAKFTCYLDAPAKQPYCVTIGAGSAPGEFVIEGYGQSADKPIVVEKATVGVPRPPKP